VYISGEKIWFKAYVVDAFSHQSPTYSRYAYIELINSSDSLVHRVMVSPDEKGLLYGSIFLSERIPEGDYTLRAYTRYMENLGDDYFFKKTIRIANLNGGNRESGGNRGNGGEFEVSFFPEGGNLTEGVISRIAFKALNQEGASENITGDIVDKAGNLIVADVATVFAGMGSFAFMPESGNEYTLVSETVADRQSVSNFRLPKKRMR